MKILRLFINNDLSENVNWIEVSDDKPLMNGSSTFVELADIAAEQIEVYLNANCCSVFKANVAGISTKRLTEELVLGIIEDGLTDEIDQVKPIVLRTEDDIAYIAVFNRNYYEELLEKLVNIHKPIRFLQSFVYSTAYNEDGGWSLYLSDEQNFVRTSKYEYYLLDDNKPIPLLLEDMLLNEKPNSIMVYANQKYDLEQFKKFDVGQVTLVNDLEFGTQVWNFYNQKSTKFKIKLDDSTKTELLLLSKTFKYFAIFLILFWLIDIITLSINNYRLNSELKNQLKGIVSVTNINTSLIQAASDEITKMRHERGIYAEKDAIPLFSTFLNIVSDVNNDMITQINYSGGQLQIFLNNRFSPYQFNSYRNIFATRRINAQIQDYNLYMKEHKADQANNDNSILSTKNQIQISDDTAWVITLKPSLVQYNMKEIK